jgi:hypothetical protein
MSTIWSQSGVNLKGEPFVQLTLKDNVIGQLTPAQAREFAGALLQAAEAAETDSFILGFFRDTINAPLEAAFAAMRDFRSKREAMGGMPANKVETWTVPFDPTKRKV